VPENKLVNPKGTKVKGYDMQLLIYTTYSNNILFFIIFRNLHLLKNEIFVKSKLENLHATRMRGLAAAKLA
jgi:hypothetical protein